MNQLRYCIPISLLAHALLLCLAIWGALFFQGADSGGRGGDGGVVSVWLAGADGAAVGETGAATPPRQGARRDAMARATQAPGPPTPPSPASAGAAEGSGGGGNSLSGEGIGDGFGSGVGSGTGGDPALATIWRKINRSKYYPEIARRERLEGAPRVTFSINADGSVGSVDIATSCGQAILDEAAKETVRRAAPLPYYASPITLAVRYELR